MLETVILFITTGSHRFSYGSSRNLRMEPQMMVNASNCDLIETVNGLSHLC